MKAKLASAVTQLQAIVDNLQDCAQEAEDNSMGWSYKGYVLTRFPGMRGVFALMRGYDYVQRPFDTPEEAKTWIDNGAVGGMGE